MLELKTLRKADHLLTMPEAAAAPGPSREANQRRLMVVALALLLMALAVILYKDRDFWFPDTQEADDQLQPVPVAETTAKPSTPTAQPPATVKSAVPEKKVFTGISRPPKTSAPGKVEVAADTPPAPMTATTTRTVLPPLEVEVVAGDNHSTVHPGTNSVHVDLQPRTAPHSVTSASSNSPATAAGITSNAAEHVQMSVGTAEVVGEPVNPGYPMLARQMRVQGSVILQALIGRDGTIQSLHVMSGPPILASAAQEAVRQWHFKPHFIGNEPVETQANITVNFSISTN